MDNKNSITLKQLFRRSFWIWLLTSVVLVVAFCFYPPLVRPFCGVIMALLFLLPIREWAYELLTWEIDWLTSKNTDVKDALNPTFTLNTLTDPKKRFQNDGAYRGLRFIILVACTIIALAWMMFQNAAANVVYAVLHTLEYIVRGRIGWGALFIWTLVEVAGVYHIYWSAGQLLKGKLYERDIDEEGKVTFSFDITKSWWRIAIMLGGFYLRIIVSGLLLKFTFGMIWSAMCLWTVVVILVLVFCHFGSLRWLKMQSAKKKKKTTEDTDDKDDEKPDDDGTV